MVKIVVSQNKERVAMIRKQLKENGGYCPCAFDQNDDTICQCKDFRDQDEPGECLCGRYAKVVDYVEND